MAISALERFTTGHLPGCTCTTCMLAGPRPEAQPPPDGPPPPEPARPDPAAPAVQPESGPDTARPWTRMVPACGLLLGSLLAVAAAGLLVADAFWWELVSSSPKARPLGTLPGGWTFMMLMVFGWAALLLGLAVLRGRRFPGERRGVVPGAIFWASWAALALGLAGWGVLAELSPWWWWALLSDSSSLASAGFLVPAVGTFLGWTMLSSAILYAWRVRSLPTPERVAWSVAAAAGNLVFYGFSFLLIDGWREGTLQALLELL